MKKFDLVLEIAEKADVKTPRDGLVLYSVSYQKTKENKLKAQEFVKNTSGKMLLEDTLCGLKLIVLGVESENSELTDEEKMEIWRVALLRAIAEASGDVTFFADHADIRGRLLDVGIEAILANDRIETINKIDKFDFAQENIDWKRKMNAVLDLIAE